MAGEKLHPVETGELIDAQRGLQAGGGWHRIDSRKIFEFSGQRRKVRGGGDTQAFETGERRGIQRVETGFIRKPRVDQRGEVLQDFPHAANGEFQCITIRQRRVDVAVVRAVEGFFEKIVF